MCVCVAVGGGGISARQLFPRHWEEGGHHHPDSSSEGAGHGGEGGATALTSLWGVPSWSWVGAKGAGPVHLRTMWRSHSPRGPRAAPSLAHPQHLHSVTCWGRSSLSFTSPTPQAWDRNLWHSPSLDSPCTPHLGLHIYRMTGWAWRPPRALSALTC